MYRASENMRQHWECYEYAAMCVEEKYGPRIQCMLVKIEIHTKRKRVDSHAVIMLHKSSFATEIMHLFQKCLIDKGCASILTDDVDRTMLSLNDDRLNGPFRIYKVMQYILKIETRDERKWDRERARKITEKCKFAPAGAASTDRRVREAAFFDCITKFVERSGSEHINSDVQRAKLQKEARELAVKYPHVQCEYTSDESDEEDEKVEEDEEAVEESDEEDEELHIGGQVFHLRT
jgi:hypothetical protein